MGRGIYTNLTLVPILILILIPIPILILILIPISILILILIRGRGRSCPQRFLNFPPSLSPFCACSYILFQMIYMFCPAGEIFNFAKWAPRSDYLVSGLSYSRSPYNTPIGQTAHEVLVLFKKHDPISIRYNFSRIRKDRANSFLYIYNLGSIWGIRGMEF
jgi:hypothetical protein